MANLAGDASPTLAYGIQWGFFPRNCITAFRLPRMADQDDVRRIALALPQAVGDEESFSFGVRYPSGKQKSFAWVWLERLDPKKGRVPQPDVVAVRVPNEGAKQELLASDPAKFFTEQHYDGFPAILVRLAEVEEGELTELLTDAWRCQAPKALVKESGL